MATKVPEFKTRLTEMLGVKYPVMSAGMGGVAFNRLTAAVSEAGGFGTIGAATMIEEQLQDELTAVRKATSKPFGVDLLGNVPNLEQKLDIIIESGAKAFITGLGFQKSLVERCHQKNMLVGVVIGKVSHAVNAVKAGVDFVIAQGTEAGGHTGEIGLFALLPQVVDAVGKYIPVAAAGSICDSRGMVAAFALGAEAIWVGTRFIATPEANTVPHYKEAIIAAKEDSTTISRAYTGKPCRVKKSLWTEEWSKKPEQLQGFGLQNMVAINEGASHLGGNEKTEGVDPKREFFMMGQGAGLINDVVPAGDLVRRFASDYEKIVERLVRKPLGKSSL
eukprot:TRINITY_DN10851_c0_g1_i1.p1 TRINITY_DN10851_c0_g1~~TRINITY_DN10851_c0_g1_i1.p1  ORF type:complete len:334 (-),score=75.03 TRINITY_DN10851_c0_g1_i1:49-1050(-)